MTGYLDIEHVLVPRELVNEGHRFMRDVGKLHKEGIALWAGYRDVTTFIVDHLLIPQQRGITTDSGVCAVIHGDELARIGRSLYEAKRQLFAQLHTHPTDAYHSVTDDENAVVTTYGGLSLVIPDFAVNPFDLLDCATYRLDKDGVWVEMHPKAVSNFIRIVGD